ncbi:MAG: lysylphosphatidylglycerol synthase transmembrane domain-containing protein, partial [Bacteroidales bacterium]|nr:lysylphosphatidylglycerol synthase transmembrane domain-containing protein [Bacteroidales bacterium]
MKRFFNILFYLSIIIFVIYLTQVDYLVFSDIQLNYWYLGLAIVFLWTGFYFSTQSWWYALKIHKIKISRKTGLISHGLSIFAKYIPGKVWMILGRASYVAKDEGISAKTPSVASLKEQLVFIMSGMLISILPILYFDFPWYIPWIVVSTSVGIALFLFVKPVHNLSQNILSKLFKKPIAIPLISISKAIKLGFYTILYWSCWILSFYFLIQAVGIHNSFVSAFIFPISAIYGILAIIVPGGIGVREGIMVSLFVFLG